MRNQSKGIDFSFPEHLHFEKTNHTWSLAESNSRIVIGMDPLGLASLGELAYLSIDEVETMVREGQSMGVLEAAKMTGEIIAPVSGKIVERNQEVLEDPFQVNKDPYGKGWLALIETESWEEDSKKLVTGAKVAEWSSNELERYRQQGWID